MSKTNITFDNVPSVLGNLMDKVDRMEGLLIFISGKVTNDIQNSSADELLTIHQASEITKYKVQTLRTMVMKGQIPSVRIGRKRLFWKSILMNWLKEQ